jgi:hypothetical protein
MTPLTNRLFVATSTSVLRVVNAKALVEIVDECSFDGVTGYLDIRVQNRDGHTWRGYVLKDAYAAATRPDTRIR